MRPIILSLTLLASVFTLPLTARADAIDRFTFDFDTPPGYDPIHLTVYLPASPPPSSPGFGFPVCPPDYCFSVLGESDPGSYIFYFGSNWLRFAPFDPAPVKTYTLIFLSEDIFTGSFSDPTFLTGTFDAEYTPLATSLPFPGTITIEPIDTTVPEPSTFAMMATGILGAIATLRSRKPGVSSNNLGTRQVAGS